MKRWATKQEILLNHMSNKLFYTEHIKNSWNSTVCDQKNKTFYAGRAGDWNTFNTAENAEVLTKHTGHPTISISWHNDMPSSMYRSTQLKTSTAKGNGLGEWQPQTFVRDWNRKCNLACLGDRLQGVLAFFVFSWLLLFKVSIY